MSQQQQQQSESLFTRFQQAMDSPPLTHQVNQQQQSSIILGDEKNTSTISNNNNDNLGDLDLDRITAEILAHHVSEEEEDAKNHQSSLGPSLQNSAEEEEATKDFKSFPAPLVHSTGANHSNYNQAHSSLSQRSALENKPLGVVPTRIPKVVNFPSKVQNSSGSKSHLARSSSGKNNSSKSLGGSHHQQQQQQQPHRHHLGESAELTRSTGSNKSASSDSNTQQSASAQLNAQQQLHGSLNNSQQQHSVRYRHPVDPVAQAEAQKQVKEQLNQSSMITQQHQQQQGSFVPQPQMVPVGMMPPQQHQPMMMVPMASPPQAGAVPMQGYYVQLPNGQMAFQPVMMPIQ